MARTATRTANVFTRVDPETKEQAEAILQSLGISSSAGINMFYRQIILWNGLPFRPSIPLSRPRALEDMSREELDAKLARGLMQAENGEGMEAEEFFASLREELTRTYG